MLLRMVHTLMYNDCTLVDLFSQLDGKQRALLLQTGFNTNYQYEAVLV